MQLCSANNNIVNFTQFTNFAKFNTQKLKAYYREITFRLVSNQLGWLLCISTKGNAAVNHFSSDKEDEKSEVDNIKRKCFCSADIVALHTG